MLVLPPNPPPISDCITLMRDESSLRISAIRSRNTCVPWVQHQTSISSFSLQFATQPWGSI